MLQVGDFVLTDSPRIIDWLEERVAEPPLYPREPAQRAVAAVFVQWFNRVWKVAPNSVCSREAPPRCAALSGPRMRALDARL